MIGSSHDISKVVAIMYLMAFQQIIYFNQLLHKSAHQGEYPILSVATHKM
jgi:hypothetical protein